MQKFRVNLDLKQYEKAVKALAKGDKKLGDSSPDLQATYFNEALSLFKKHRLFKQALSFY